MKFEIEQNLVQALGDYLASKPYREVAGLLQELQKLVPVAEKEDGPN